MKNRTLLYSLLLVILSSTAYANTPGNNFDLSDWKLQGLDNSRNLLTVQGPALEDGFSNAWFFSTISSNMYFKCPSNGEPIVTGGLPRVELRQMGKGANWPLNDSKVHKLTASCSVDKVAPVKTKVIIGQIHGSQKNSELVKVRWTGDMPGKCLVEARF